MTCVHQSHLLEDMEQVGSRQKEVVKCDAIVTRVSERCRASYHTRPGAIEAIDSPEDAHVDQRGAKGRRIVDLRHSGMNDALVEPTAGESCRSDRERGSEGPDHVLRDDLANLPQSFVSDRAEEIMSSYSNRRAHLNS